LTRLSCTESDSTSLDFNPTVDALVIGPTADDSSSEDSFIEVSLANDSDVHGEDTNESSSLIDLLALKFILTSTLNKLNSQVELGLSQALQNTPPPKVRTNSASTISP
jgi:hypothetical protein